MIALLDKKKVFFSNAEFKFMMTWAIEAHSKIPPTDFCFRIALDFAENGPLLYLPSGYLLNITIHVGIPAPSRGFPLVFVLSFMSFMSSYYAGHVRVLSLRNTGSIQGYMVEG